MKTTVILAVLASAALVAPDAMADSDFYAYYTRVDYEILLGAALDVIPIEPTEEDKMILRQMRELRGEEEEEDEEFDEEEDEDEEDGGAEGPITGRYADIVVNLASGQLVFSRETSYQPQWKTEDGSWALWDILPRQVDVACLYSYVRIIENTPERILIHWRYVPNVRQAAGFASAAHEYYEITPDGKVTRRARRAALKLDDWNDPANVTTQVLRLSPDGIEELSLTHASFSNLGGKPLPGSKVKPHAVGTPAAWWKFDEGLAIRPSAKKDVTQESVGGKECSVAGNTTLWKKGISGTALAFDGYFSQVALPAADAPTILDEVTLEAWVVLGAYPWNWAPLVHQSIMDPGPIERGNYDEQGTAIAREPGQGYYLGVDGYGYPIFTVDGNEVKGSTKLARNRWVHIAGTYGQGKMRVYVDGQEAGTLDASGEIAVPDADVIIGLNNVKGRATDPVRVPVNHMASVYGIEGLIDEVKIYNQALDSAQVRASYSALKPDDALRDNPDIEPRILPGEIGEVDEFKAYYTTLKYHDLWDNLWRVGDDADIAVKFADVPTSVVFWRGPNSASNWITENNKWMADQSCEVWGLHGCSEHMADKECRHAYVRMIENTDARAVIHWRYASIDVGYLFPGPQYWADEYYTIYPDGTGVRKVHFRGGVAGWQDVQFFSQPGTSPLDNIELQALTLANLKGEVRPLTWQGANGVPENTLPDACIEVVNFKSEHDVFLIFQEGTYISPWGHAEQSVHTDDPFAGPWNHWPVSLIPSDGRFAVDNDRLTHAAVAAADNVVEHGNMVLYGFTNKDAGTLVPLARSWNNPPKVSSVMGCRSRGYDKAQKAYVFRAAGSVMSFTLNASEQSPVVNPCLVIKKWGSRTAQARVRVGGKNLASGADLRQGIITDTDGTPTLVIWLRTSAAKRTMIEISQG